MQFSVLNTESKLYYSQNKVSLSDWLYYCQQLNINVIGNTTQSCPWAKEPRR